ncbi:MAG TPA: hypothetical protein VGG04_15010 [Candidatus Sulfotelmatobacter sp.]|jgi:hypothetical protein
MNPIAGKIEGPHRARGKWKSILAGSLVLLLILATWITVSRNPYAEGVRAIFGRTPDQAIIDRNFTVGPRGFRFYKFTLPEGSAHMAVVGKFSASGEGGGNLVEVLIFGEDQLRAWQTGDSVQSIYKSGPVAEGTVKVDLPAGGGSYVVVFSNRFSTSSLTKVTAAILLRHKNWWR